MQCMLLFPQFTQTFVSRSEPEGLASLCFQYFWRWPERQGGRCDHYLWPAWGPGSSAAASSVRAAGHQTEASEGLGGFEGGQREGSEVSHLPSFRKNCNGKPRENIVSSGIFSWMKVWCYSELSSFQFFFFFVCSVTDSAKKLMILTMLWQLLCLSLMLQKLLSACAMHRESVSISAEWFTPMALLWQQSICFYNCVVESEGSLMISCLLHMGQDSFNRKCWRICLGVASRYHWNQQKVSEWVGRDDILFPIV